MNYHQFRVFFSVLFFALILQSCNKDTDDFTSQNLIDSRQSQGGQNDNSSRNGPNNGQNEDVASLQSTLALQWTDLFLKLDRYATGMRPTSTARSLAYIHLAAYETVVPGMRDFVSNDERLQGLTIRNNGNPRNIDWEIALNATYADVLDHFMLNISDELRQEITTLEKTLEENYANQVSNRTLNDSKRWGKSIAEQIIEFAQTDFEGEQQIHEAQPLSYEPPTGDGYWTYSAEQERALFPYWGKVRTFIIAPDETTTVKPIKYSTNPQSAYYKEMEEVYHANNQARAQDGEALWIAEFWSDDVEGITFSPPARQFSIANQLITDQSLNLAEALHLNLKLAFSLNDAAVSTWKYKYEYMVMRPNVFIHEYMDPNYQTNLYRLIPWPNPTFPGYPSGHSSFASAAAGVFIDFFGNAINFTDVSHEGRTEFRGAARSFTSFEDLAAENAFSRIPLGVHIRMDCTEGLRLGYEIADAINDYRLKRRAQ